MAKVSLKKKPSKVTGITWPGESGPGHHTVSYATHQGRQKFNPLASPYSTNADFTNAVNNTAQLGIQPQLDENTRETTAATGAHTGRQNDITSMYNINTKARQDALTAAGTALNGLITSNAGADKGTQDAMAAALRAGQDRENAVNAQLGLASQGDGGQAYTNAIQAGNDVGDIGLTGQFASILGGLGRDVGTSEIGRREASDAENNRWDSVYNDLTTGRQQLTDQLPGLREQARQNLSATELARQGQQEQQRLANTQEGLAEDQFGEQKVQDKSQRSLSKRQQTETERSNKAQETLSSDQNAETVRSNQAGEAINQAQVDNTRRQLHQDAINAQNTTDAVGAKAKADRFDAGVKLLTDYLKPTKGETRKSGSAKTTYTARVTNGYDAMIQQLMSATGAGPVEAREMVLSAVNPQSPWGRRWTTRAQREIAAERADRLRKRPNTSPGSGSNPVAHTGRP